MSIGEFSTGTTQVVDGLSASIISLLLRTQIKAMFKAEKKGGQRWTFYP